MDQRRESSGAPDAFSHAPAGRRAGLTFFSCLLACTFTLLVAGALGCGDDGPGVAELGADNIDDLGVAATEVATRAIALDAANFLAAASAGPGGPFAARADAEAETAVDPVLMSCDQGYITASPSGSRIDFVACELGDCQIDGRASASIGDGGDRIVIRLVDVIAECVGEPPVAFQGDRVICDGMMTAMPECRMDMSSFYAPLSARRLGVHDLVVEGGQVSAKIRHPHYGTFWMQTEEPLDLDTCAAGVPSEGTISFWGGDEVAYATIHFFDCDAYETCFVDADGFGHPCADGDWMHRMGPGMPGMPGMPPGP